MQPEPRRNALGPLLADARKRGYWPAMIRSWQTRSRISETGFLPTGASVAMRTMSETPAEMTRHQLSTFAGALILRLATERKR